MSVRIPKTRSRTGCFTCRKKKKKCDELLYPVCQNCQEKNLACRWPPKKHEFHKNMEEIKYIGYEDKIHNARETNTRKLKRNSSEQRNTYSEDEIQLKKRNEGQKGLEETSFMPIRSLSEVGDVLAIKEIENDISATQTTIYNNQFPHEVPIHCNDSTSDASDNVPSDFENHSGQYVPVRHTMNPKSLKPPSNSKLDSTQLQKRHNYFLERIAMQQDCVDSEEEIMDITPASPFEIESLIDNEYILNDNDKQDHVERAQSPVPKAEAILNDHNQTGVTFPLQITVSSFNHEPNVHSSLLPLKTTNSTGKDSLPN